MPVTTISGEKAYRSYEIMKMYGIGETKVYEILRGYRTIRMGRYKVVPESELRKFEQRSTEMPAITPTRRRPGRKEGPRPINAPFGILDPNDPKFIKL